MDGALPSPAAAMESHVLSMFPRCPFSSLKGRWRKLRDSRALRAAREHTSITTAAAISCKSITLLHHWHWRQNPSWDPWQVWGGHAHQPGSSPGPISNLLPSLVTGRARGSSPFAGRVSVQGRAVLWGISLLLVCL